MRSLLPAIVLACTLILPHAAAWNVYALEQRLAPLLERGVGGSTQAAIVPCVVIEAEAPGGPHVLESVEGCAQRAYYQVHIHWAGAPDAGAARGLLTIRSSVEDIRDEVADMVRTMSDDVVVLDTGAGAVISRLLGQPRGRRPPRRRHPPRLP